MMCSSLLAPPDRKKPFLLVYDVVAAAVGDVLDVVAAGFIDLLLY